ncbi:hypothetical protein ABT354_19315 [Streptomyces sp. NPDC000594]|uniref:hypothetical protein n=1 Tax=Streptomyces sp. NPDC000594 TaxID=3154261 RepID=UPI003321D6DD
MNEPNPYRSEGSGEPAGPEGEPEYRWGPSEPPGYGPGYGYPQAPPPGPYPPQPHPYPPTQGYPPPVQPGPPTQPYPAQQPYPPAQLSGMAVPAYGAPLAGMAPVLTIGDITVVGDQILTPSGPIPLKGAVWHAMDLSQTTEKIPTYAVVLAVTFALACLLGLFFLLIKEKEVTGFIQVSVAGGGRQHTTMIPAHNPYAIHHIMEQINYARLLSA